MKFVLLCVAMVSMTVSSAEFAMVRVLPKQIWEKILPPEYSYLREQGFLDNVADKHWCS